MPLCIPTCIQLAKCTHSMLISLHVFTEYWGKYDINENKYMLYKKRADVLVLFNVCFSIDFIYTIAEETDVNDKMRRKEKLG